MKKSLSLVFGWALGMAFSGTARAVLAPTDASLIEESYRIDCGSNTGRSLNGKFWAADEAYTTLYRWGFRRPEDALPNVISPTSTGTISASLPEGTHEIYRSYREGEEVRYIIEAPNGGYQLTFHFIEPVHASSGARVFTIGLDDSSVTKTVDIAKAVGGKNLPYELPFGQTINVADGSLEIVLKRSFGAPALISGLELTVSTDTASAVTDDSFLTFMARKLFWYFWNESDPETGLTRDYTWSFSPGGQPQASIASTGFALTAYTIAARNNWHDVEQIKARIQNTLNAFSNSAILPQYHGFWYHFMEKKDNRWQRWGTSEVSTVDSALFLMGALQAAEYFPEFKDEVDAIYSAMDWKWFTNRGYDNPFVSMGWRPEPYTEPDLLRFNAPNGGAFLANAWWNQYSESVFVNLLALAAPADKSIEPTAWTQMARHWQVRGGMEYMHYSPLFVHQYHHLYYDLKNTHDQFADYWQNSTRATRIQKMITQGDPRYAANRWGFSAAYGWNSQKNQEDYLNYGVDWNDGTVVPTAPGGSLHLTETESTDALRHMYFQYKHHLWGRNGFTDSFNVDSGYVAEKTLGLDNGPILISAANKLWKIGDQGFVQHYFMKSPPARLGMQRAGLTSYDAPYAIASSVKDERHARLAFDGDPATRWESQWADGQFLGMDFLSPRTVNHVRLAWETAFADAYRVQWSNDGAVWADATPGPLTSDGETDDLYFPAITARYVRLFGDRRHVSPDNEVWGQSILEAAFDNRPLPSASSVKNGNQPWMAFDGNPATRWESDFSDGHWLAVDFDEPRTVSHTKIQWEFAHADEYRIQWSMDGVAWNDTTAGLTKSDGGVDHVYFAPVTARRMRIYCAHRATPWGNSIFEAAFDNPPPPFASSEKDGNTAFAAFDGNPGTRWESQWSNGESLGLRFVNKTAISRVRLTWEAAYADQYRPQWSLDGVTWNDTSAGLVVSDGGADEVYFTPVAAHYFRILCVQRAPGNIWGNSIFEAVFDNPPPPGVGNLALAAKTATSLRWSWVDQSSNEAGFRVYGSVDSAAPFTLLADLPPNTSSFNEFGLTPGTTYYRRFVAHNRIDETPSANTTASTPPLDVSLGPKTADGTLRAALDGDGRLHVSHFDPDQLGLRYALWNGTAWTMDEEIDPTADGYSADDGINKFLAANDLALDAQGRPHVVYYSATGSLRHAVRTNGTWVVQPVASVKKSVMPALTVDPAGTVHILFSDPGPLRYARGSNGTWTIEPVAGGVAANMSHLAVDGTGAVHVIYGTNNYPHELRYTCRDTGGWSAPVTADAIDTGRYRVHPTLVIDGDGRPRIVDSLNNRHGRIRYTRLTDTGWTAEYAHKDAADWNHTGTPDPGFLLDGAGRPHTLYDMHFNYDPHYTRVTLAQRTDTGWEETTLAEDTRWNPGAALTMDAAGVAHIVTQSHQGQLRLIRQPTGAPAPLGGGRNGRVQAPANFAMALTPTGLRCTWEDRAQNETGYRLYGAAQIEGPYTVLGDLPPNSVTFLDESIESPWTYRFVAARNDSGEVASGVATVIPGTPVAYASSVKNGNEPRFAFDGNPNTRWESEWKDDEYLALDFVTEKTLSQARIQWEAAYAETYRIQWSNDGVTWADTSAGTVTSDGGTDDVSFSPQSARHFRILCVKRHDTRWGNSIMEVGFSLPPTAPAELQLAGGSGTSLRWTWRDTSIDESGYRVYGATTSAGPFTLVASLPSNTSSFEEFGLTPGTLHFRRIAAYNTSGEASAPDVSATTTPLDVFLGPNSSDGTLRAALDGNGRLHVSHFDPDQQGLRYALWSGTAWTVDEEIDPTADGYSAGDGINRFLAANDLALDAQNRPHVVYYSTGIGLRHAVRTETGWVVNLVTATASSVQPALTVDPAGVAHVVFSNPGTLYYARGSSATWTIEPVAGGVAANTSHLALDGSGAVHVIYGTDEIPHELRYTRRDRGVWSAPVTADAIDTTDRYRVNPTLVLDGDGRPRVMDVLNNRDGRIRYTRLTDSGWTAEYAHYDEDDWDHTGTPDPGFLLDGAGRPHALYDMHFNYDPHYARVTLAQRTDTGWAETTLAEDARWNPGAALAMDAAGVAHIVTQSHQGQLRLIRQPTGAPGPIGGGRNSRVQAPANFTLSVSSSGVLCAWEDRAQNETGYRLYGATRPEGPFTPLLDLPAGTTRSVEPPPSTPSLYRFVTARNAAGEIPSNWAVFIATPPAVPGKPYANSADITPTSIQWRWARSAGATYYQLRTSTDGVVVERVPATTASVQTYPIINLGVNTAHTLKVIAFNSVGAQSSSPSSVVVYTRANEPAGTVVSLVNGKAKVTWTSNGNPAGTEFTAYYSTYTQSSKVYKSILTTTGTTATTSFKLSPGITYWFRVGARNGINGFTGTRYWVYGSTVSLSAPAAAMAMGAAEQPRLEPGLLFSPGGVVTEASAIYLDDMTEPLPPVPAPWKAVTAPITATIDESAESLLAVAYDRRVQGTWTVARLSEKGESWIVQPPGAASPPGVYALWNAPAANLSALRVFPNPFRPARGQSEVTINNMKAHTRVRFYTVTGELVNEIVADSDGKALWTGVNQAGRSVASGVYLGVAESDGEKATFRLAVEQ